MKLNSGNFISHDGTKIFYQSWQPDSNKNVKAVLAIVHGYAEHGGRYAHVGKYFADKGFYVEAIDHRAHGHSDGKDTFFKSIDDCVEDVDLFIKRLKDEWPELPVFVLAHSMGGLIAVKWAEDKQPDVKGMLLSGPAVMIDKSIPPLLIKLSSVAAKIAPKMKTISLDGNAVSRDPEEVEKYNSDPLNYRGGIPAATGAAMNAAIREVHANTGKYNLPVRIMYGTEDRLADPRGSQLLYAGFSSTDKTLVPYENLYHEILNEPEKEQIMEECLEWINARMT